MHGGRFLDGRSASIDKIARAIMGLESRNRRIMETFWQEICDTAYGRCSKAAHLGGVDHLGFGLGANATISPGSKAVPSGHLCPGIEQPKLSIMGRNTQQLRPLVGTATTWTTVTR